MNVVSFCLFGPDPTYCRGALRNAELMHSVYPGWTMRVYTGSQVPAGIVDALRNSGVEIQQADPSLNPMLSRFLVASDPKVAKFLIRDTDSRINPREKGAVDAWAESSKSFHVIRDHPYHQVVMPGGLWGGKGGILNVPKLIKAWKGPTAPGARDQIYGQDQFFLRDMVWPLINSDVLEHDFCLRRVFTTAVPFPATYPDVRFCGEKFDASDQPDPTGWQQRLNFLQYIP